MEVGKDGVQMGATLHLDRKMMKDDGKERFFFADGKGGKRIERTENELASANLRIRPVMTFKFAEVQGWTLPESVEFKIDGAGLSGSMRGMEMITVLRYRNYTVTK